MGSKIQPFLHTHKSRSLLFLPEADQGGKLDYKLLSVILLDRNCFFWNYVV